MIQESYFEQLLNEENRREEVEQVVDNIGMMYKIGSNELEEAIKNIGNKAR